MLSQVRRKRPPSVRATIAATGAVCPAKKTAAVSASNTGSDAHAAWICELACHNRLARLAANPIMLTLNSICSGLNLLPGLGRLCIAVERHAIVVASTALRLIAAINRNGRLTDMFPVMPGSLTFILEVAAASA